jgi:hypothetical protein
VTYLVEDTACRMEPGDVVLVKHHTIHKAEIDRSIQYDRVIIYLDPAYIDRTAPSADLLRCFDTPPTTAAAICSDPMKIREKK